MDGNLLARRGFSFIEISFVLTLVATLIVASVYSAARIKQAAFAQRTIAELDAIASVSIQYYKENGAWPESLDDLRPGYLSSQVSSSNPFGNAYVITPQVSGVSVATVLPKGLVTSNSFGSEIVVINQGSNDSVKLTKAIESITWKLKYDKKNVYKQ